jgi:hypothetical protein
VIGGSRDRKGVESETRKNRVNAEVASREQKVYVGG